MAVCLAAPPSSYLGNWNLSPLAGLESGGVCLSFVAFLFRGGQREASSTPLLRHWRRRTQKDPSRGRVDPAAEGALKVDSFFKTHRGLKFA